jgi:hypothetical protein
MNMRKNRKKSLTLVLSMVAFFAAACSTGSFGATATPSATFTPDATSTPTKRPTSTPRPTFTNTPTPAPLGVSVSAGDFSFTVVDAVSLRRIYPGGQYLYTPNPGYLILDMGIRIQNNNPGKLVSIPWENVYVEEANGDSWYPLWGKAELVDADVELDPFTLGISSEEIDGIERINFTGDAYLRLVFIVDDNDNQPVPIIFGIGNSPVAAFDVAQPN